MGSPHWESSDHRRHFRFKASSQFKTNAFESMAWGSPFAMVCMTFLECYRTEFYHPKFNRHYGSEVDNRCERALIVCQGYFSKYKPMTSGNELCVIDQGRGCCTMIAMLVPERFMECVVWRGVKLDFGMTILRVMQAMDKFERAIELGGQTFAMSMELHYAHEEVATNEHVWPPL